MLPHLVLSTASHVDYLKHYSSIHIIFFYQYFLSVVYFYISILLYLLLFLLSYTVFFLFFFFFFPVFLVLFYLTEVILGQNCVWLLDTALNDLFFSKICFIKNSVNMLSVLHPDLFWAYHFFEVN